MDGTLSLLRDGWQDAMVPMMVEFLEACPRAESRDEIERLVIDFVDHLTGKQTVYQMMRLGEEVAKRGGRPRDPLDYKDEYHRRLDAQIRDRHESVRSGRAPRERFILPGARAFLDALRDRGVHCYLASGTDVEFVREECELLDIDRHFDGGIFGALRDHESFSKEKVIRGIIEKFSLEGPELLIVGDGYVEIVNAREVGATAYGLSSAENNRYHMNADKRGRLVRAGTHLLAPDLTDGLEVLDWLSAS
jgi:phosphoglycolate phosphatase